ncbi:MAG: RNA polymerase-binding protein DksA [Neisseriaceae bacterium]|nr:RNA polymerase-binding protein DksA [Neisseriaceae bacterium]
MAKKKLTEKDILAWDGPEEDYMNAAHLLFFKQKLLKLQDDIINKATGTAEYMQDQETTPDPADRATLEEEYSLELRTRDRERKLLSKVQASLRQIEEGTYGYCKDTGEPIGLKRLLIRPTATLSIEAQERREQMKKQFAG